MKFFFFFLNSQLFVIRFYFNQVDPPLRLTFILLIQKTKLQYPFCRVEFSYSGDLSTPFFPFLRISCCFINFFFIYFSFPKIFEVQAINFPRNCCRGEEFSSLTRKILVTFGWGGGRERGREKRRRRKRKIKAEEELNWDVGSPCWNIYC